MAIAAAGLILVSAIASAAIPAILLLWFDLFVWFRLSALLAPALLSQYSPGCVGPVGGPGRHDIILGGTFGRRSSGCLGVA